MDSSSARVLQQLCKANSRARQRLLNKESVQKLLREVSLNILKGNVSLKPKQLIKLKKEARFVRRLANPKTTHKSRVRITQKGGFLPLLLLPAIRIIKDLLSG